MLKRIKDEEIIRALYGFSIEGYQGDLITERDKIIAQAQLEADQRDTEAMVREIFEEIAYKAIHTHGKGDSTLTISYPKLEAIKQKGGVRNE